MFAALKTSFIILFLASGVWLYVMKETGTAPIGTLLLYAILWFVAGVVGLALLKRRPTPKKTGAGANPYEKLGTEERERARAILKARFDGREVTTEDRNWLSILLERHAPLLSPSEQVERFTEYLASLPVVATDASEPDWAEPPMAVPPDESLHGGPAIVLARAQRRPDFDVTKDGSSWFGGLPALGDQTWPTDNLGQPMTPLAQIDLTGLSRHLNLPDLPTSGSLAFFAALPDAGTWLGRVVHVRSPGPVIEPPRPLRPVLDHSIGGFLRRGEPADGQRLYPRMAIELVAISASGLTNKATFAAEVEATLGPGRDVNVAVSLLQGMAGRGHPWNRDSLLRFLHGARLSLGSGDKAEAELRKTQTHYGAQVKSLTETLGKPDVTDRDVLRARLDNTKAALKRLDAILADLPAATQQLVEELETMEVWARAGERWPPLTDAEQKQLAPVLEPWTVYANLGWVLLDQTYSIHRQMEDCVLETLLVLSVAPDRDFAVLPDPLRAAVQGPWRQPNQGYHQMFGSPVSIQTAAEDNLGSYLLLQLRCDDIAGFHWGDAGVLQFWIRPQDLQAGDWERAYMTFEGH